MLVSMSAIGILLLLSAFFSGSETALTAASRPLMHQLENKGNRRAGTVNRLYENRDMLIGSILLGNNLVNILASALATSIMIGMFGETGIVFATITMTLLILIFAEILPKTYAFYHADRAALAVAPLVKGCVNVLAPVTGTLHFLVRGIFKLFGINYQTRRAVGSSADVLLGAIDLHAGEGEALDRERTMLRSILDLANVDVSEIMVHRKNVVMIDADLPPADVIAEMLASPFTRVPLWRGQPENIVGILHAKAVFSAVRARDDVNDLNMVALAAKPWFIPETTKLLDQLQVFLGRRTHFALMVDEYGSFMGIVTLEDILEEIVGDIADEHDIPVTSAEEQSDGSYIVEGSVTIRDLNRQFDWRLPDEEAATIAGLMLHESRRIPEVGQAFMFHGFRFDIIHRRRHQITSVRITPPTAMKGMPEDEGRETET